VTLKTAPNLFAFLKYLFYCVKLLSQNTIVWNEPTRSKVNLYQFELGWIIFCLLLWKVVT